MEKQTVGQPAACKQAKLVFHMLFNKLTICGFQKQHNEAAVRSHFKGLGSYLSPCSQSTSHSSSLSLQSLLLYFTLYSPWTLFLPAGFRGNNMHTDAHTQTYSPCLSPNYLLGILYLTVPTNVRSFLCFCRSSPLLCCLTSAHSYDKVLHLTV